MNDCNKDKKLKFVHITKTSGTYIEDIALKKNIKWGRFDEKLQYISRKFRRNGPGSGSPWHEPIIYLNEFPYDDKTNLFTIVRNPYDRIVSECLCKWGGEFAKKMDTPEDLNFYINEQVNRALNLNFHHFVPQYIYTHDSKGKQIVNHIIKFEEMEKFNDLMKEYNIDLVYDIKPKNKKKFNISDISQKNIELINNVYHLDFEYYNYEKIKT